MKNIRKVYIIIMISLFTMMICCSCQSKEQHKEQEKEIVKLKETEDKKTEDKKTKETNIKDNIKADEQKVIKKDFVVCIDPGHYGGWNRIYFNDGSSYSEGDVTLPIALKLKEILENKYGIECILTRDTPDINIDGYVNESLDSGKISLRGVKSEGCDLFISIHTNANLDFANGYETLYQPVSLNRPVIILNKIAMNNEESLNVANKVGERITETLKNNELTSTGEFNKVYESSQIKEWSDELNDSLNSPGTLFYRLSDNGDDYYGVLRGAATVGVPGMIVEHSFHTVPEIREALLNGNLIEELAKADADGIAEGLGIKKDDK